MTVHTEATTPQQTRLSLLSPLDVVEALEQTAGASLRDTGGIPEPLQARLTALNYRAGRITDEALQLAEELWERGVRDMEGVGFEGDSCTVEPALLVKST